LRQLEEYFDADIILENAPETIRTPVAGGTWEYVFIGIAVGSIMIAISFFALFRSGRHTKKLFIVKVINPLNEEPVSERALFPPNRIRGAKP
jgi:hypothetical protein